MKFLRSVALRVHAEKISRGLGSVRSQYFDFVVRRLEDQPVPNAVRSRLKLDGQADLALRGFQLWLHMAFSIMHPYVSENDDGEFTSYVAYELFGKSKKEVEGYFLKFNEFRNRYCDLLLEVAFPVALEISPDLDPSALETVATFLPFLALNTQMVIAEEFGDKTTSTRLESQIKITREAMVSGEGARVSGTDTACLNCAFLNGHEARCCSLCGVPLAFVDPGCDPKFAQGRNRSVEWPECAPYQPGSVSKSSEVEAKSLDISVEMIEKGLYFRRNHFKGISNWEERMYAEFGQAVIPLLKSIWSRIS